MRKLVIVGAGNLGRELLWWARDLREYNVDWDVKGFIDDNLDALAGYEIDKAVISRITDYVPQEEDLFTCAIANPKVRLKVCKELEDKGAKFINIIHPTCVIGSHNSIGTGLVMCPYAVISSHVTIGNHVIINLHSTVCHDAVLEDGVTLSNHCDVTGYARIETGAFLGSGARLLPRSTVGQFATVGAGCVVLEEVEAFRTVVGVPARYID